MRLEYLAGYLRGVRTPVDDQAYIAAHLVDPDELRDRDGDGERAVLLAALTWLRDKNFSQDSPPPSCHVPFSHAIHPAVSPGYSFWPFLPERCKRRR